MESNYSYHYIVELPTFSGPLELLLHLIKKHKIDILDIPIAFITEKYLEYLNMMQKINLDIASEYLEMAATLIYIKSKMLLPRSPKEEKEDPRLPLVEKLLIYQKIKEVSNLLWEREVLGRDIFKRKGIEVEKIPQELAPLGPQDLILAWERILKRHPYPPAPSFIIQPERLSIMDRINDILKKLSPNMVITFYDLVEKSDDIELIIVTFLALLELVKLNVVLLTQHKFCGDLFVVKVGDIKEPIESNSLFGTIQTPI